MCDRGHVSLERPVLVGYDGSRTSRNALAYATGLARRTQHPLLIVHVLSLYADDLAGSDPAAMGEEDPDVLADLCAEIADIADIGGLKVRMARAHGHRAHALDRVARRYHAEAIVLGAPRRRLLPFGSVPVRMLRRAHCPVIIVP